MAYTTVYKDIVFVEGDNSQAKRVQPIQTSLGGIGAHFKTLNDVKDNLANLAKLNGCNCVLDFKYGQKTALFAIDDVKYYGSGVSSILPEDTYKEILEKKKRIDKLVKSKRLKIDIKELKCYYIYNKGVIYEKEYCINYKYRSTYFISSIFKGKYCKRI